MFCQWLKPYAIESHVGGMPHVKCLYLSLSGASGGGATAEVDRSDKGCVLEEKVCLSQ